MKHMDHAAYQKRVRHLDVAALRYIIKDATEAANCSQGLCDGNEGYYRDEVHYCAAELRRRGF